jgi:hypothetical protein
MPVDSTSPEYEDALSSMAKNAEDAYAGQEAVIASGQEYVCSIRRTNGN